MNLGDIISWPVESVFQLISILLAVLILLFVVWMIFDCINRKFKVEAEKWIWIVIIFITNWVGALIYFFFIKKSNIKGVAKK